MQPVKHYPSRNAWPLIIALRGKNVALLEEGLKYCPDVNFRLASGVTPLTLAIRSGCGPFVYQLLSTGAELEYPYKEPNGKTAYISAMDVALSTGIPHIIHQIAGAYIEQAMKLRFPGQHNIIEGVTPNHKANLRSQKAMGENYTEMSIAIDALLPAKNFPWHPGTPLYQKVYKGFSAYNASWPYLNEWQRFLHEPSLDKWQKDGQMQFYGGDNTYFPHYPKSPAAPLLNLSTYSTDEKILEAARALPFFTSYPIQWEKLVKRYIEPAWLAEHPDWEKLSLPQQIANSYPAIIKGYGNAAPLTLRHFRVWAIEGQPQHILRMLGGNQNSPLTSAQETAYYLSGVQNQLHEQVANPRLSSLQLDTLKDIEQQFSRFPPDWRRLLEQFKPDKNHLIFTGQDISAFDPSPRISNAEGVYFAELDTIIYNYAHRDKTGSVFTHEELHRLDFAFSSFFTGKKEELFSYNFLSQLATFSDYFTAINVVKNYNTRDQNEMFIDAASNLVSGIYPGTNTVHAITPTLDQLIEKGFSLLITLAVHNPTLAAQTYGLIQQFNTAAMLICKEGRYKPMTIQIPDSFTSMQTTPHYATAKYCISQMLEFTNRVVAHMTTCLPAEIFKKAALTNDDMGDALFKHTTLEGRIRDSRHTAPLHPMPVSQRLLTLKDAATNSCVHRLSA